MSSRISHADHDQDYARKRPRGGVHPHVDLLPNWKFEVAARSGWIVALAIGALAVLAVRVGLFRYTGSALISDTPAITTAVEAGGAVVLSFLAFLLVPYRGAKYVFLLLVGIAISMTTMHNAVHRAPTAFSLMFSKNWTDNVIASVETPSLYLVGQVIPLVPPEEEVEEVKVLPPVLRLN